MAEERIPPVDAALPDQLVPVVFAERAVDQVPEFCRVQVALVRHQLGQVAADLLVIVGHPSDDFSDTIDCLREHVVMTLVGSHALGEQPSFYHTSLSGSWHVVVQSMSGGAEVASEEF
jgi:hypothetical protein